MIKCGTGHRPDKLGGYSEEVSTRLRGFLRSILQEQRDEVDKIISGMALGYDQALAWAAYDLGIPFLAAVPFEGQESKWPAGSRWTYKELLSKASEIVNVCEPGYAVWKMQKRNIWMVDHSDQVLALWNGTPGGTSNCVEYADDKRKIVTNLWPRWVEYCKEH